MKRERPFDNIGIPTSADFISTGATGDAIGIRDGKEEGGGGKDRVCGIGDNDDDIGSDSNLWTSILDPR